jgi:hypothetical protein
MSWNATINNLSHNEAVEALQQLELVDQYHSPATHEQFRMAKQAAIALVASVPGPRINVFLSGHANGVGWQAKDGWANDFISINVSQVTE